MKAIIPKDKQRGSSIIIDQESLEHSEETMKRTWAEFSDALARKDFDYTETDTALAVTFLKQFDKWFQGIGKTEMSLTLSECFNHKFVGRGTIIKPSEPEDLPPYERFMPISKFITADNRFSPAGIEWLYLAVKYATVVLLHRIEADTHSCDNAYNQLYRTDDNESANLRLLIDKEQSTEHNKGNTDNQRTQTNELAKRLSVFFCYSLSMIPMERGYVPSHIDNSEYGNQQT